MKKYKSAAQLRKRVNQYFSKTDPEDITLTGLILHLGVVKQTFYNWLNDDNPEIRFIIAECQLRVENSYEKKLKDKNCSGAVFALKNFGWSDSVTVKGDEEAPLQVAMTVEQLLASSDEVEA